MDPEQGQPADNPLPHNETDAPTTSAVESFLQRDVQNSAKILFGAALLAVCGISTAAVLSAYAAPIVEEKREEQLAAVVSIFIEDAFKDVALEARSAYVLDITTDEVLYEKSPSVQLPLASITKVPLVLAVSEVLEPEEVVTISRSAVLKTGGGLTWGEEWKTKDLMDFTLIASSNTGAEALAEAAEEELRERYPEAPPYRATVWRMNNLAHQLNLMETYFLNASGLDESETQAGALGSARDVARLFAYAVRTRQDLFAGTTRESMYLAPVNFYGSEARNTNVALSNIPNLLLGKTGYTDLAGGNLAIVFEPKPGRPVAIVVLGSSIEGRFSDVQTLVQATEKALSDLR